MNRFAIKFKTWFLKFLGVHEVCILTGDEIYHRIAHELLYVHRVFGNPANLIVGRNVVLNDALINTISGRVIFKDYTFCGHGVSILTGTHNYSRTGVERQTDIPQEGRDILIEEGAWISSNVTILAPCVIGRNAVIAAGSVVTGDVESGCIYAGVPARKIKAVKPLETVSPLAFRK